MPSPAAQPENPVRSASFAAVFLGLVFAAIVLLPQMFQQTDPVHRFQGMDIFGADQEVYYAARVREVYDGFKGLGNVYYSAPKDLPSVQPPLPEASIAFVGKLLGVSSVGALFLSKIVLSMAVFFAFAALLFSVTGRPWISVLSAFTVLTAGALLSAPWDLPHYFNPTAYPFEFVRFSRAVNPQWSLTFFFLALLGVSEWMRTGRRLPLALALIPAAVTIYSYLYAWTYLLSAIGLLTLWCLSTRNWKRVADLAAFWTALIVLATPYAMHLYVVTQHPWYAASSERFGMVLRHGPLHLGVWTAVFIGFSFATKKHWPRTWPFLPAVALAGAIAINQQVITGHYIVPHHYHWYFIQPMASTFAVALLLGLLPARIFRQPYGTVLAGLLVAASVTLAVVQQWAAYQGTRELWGRLQLASPVIHYVSANFRAGQVVYSQDVHIENLIPIYSGADVFFSGNADLMLSPIERSRYTYFFDLWLQGVTAEQVTREFPTIRRWRLSSRLKGIFYRESRGDYANIPDAEVEENIALYRAFIRLPLKQKLTTYPIAAVLTTPGDPANPVWSQFLSCTREVFAENGYSLRMLIQPGYPGSCL